MIVLEGPDGSGKTSLLTQLQSAFPHIETHERFSTSVGGPVDDLGTRIVADIDSRMQRHAMFYDRHPFISEFIYGPIIRNEIKDGIDEGIYVAYRERFLADSLFILCLPPIETVVANLEEDPTIQMDGVLQHISAIYDAYNDLMRYHPHFNMVWYDYTVHDTSFLNQQIRTYYNRKAANLVIS